ncbi:hypothetical protein MVEN_02453200 [Mycena venus]|uniref:Uncharacterized protein n=1 Tax=Mycena venus TaxID=2733690 RepID=A0A8H6WX83_9AGAR|nr:hypothetical protein MVEN_02453200 [Mycena venus]
MPPLAFETVVTLNQRHAHKSCISLQHNRWLVDGESVARATYWKQFKGAEAGVNGVCGSSGQWGNCTMWTAANKPAPDKDIPQAAGDFDWQGQVTGSVGAAIAMATSQDFKDGNHRTSLLYLFESVAHAGLTIGADVDYFRLYVNLKSLTDDVGQFKRKTETEVREAMTKLMKDVVRIRPTPGDSTTPVKWANRMKLADLVKTDLAQSLKDVDDYRKALEKAVEGKKDEEKWKIIREMNRKTRVEKPKLFGRFQFLWPKYDAA